MSSVPTQRATRAESPKPKKADDSKDAEKKEAKKASTSSPPFASPVTIAILVGAVVTALLFSSTQQIFWDFWQLRVASLPLWAIFGFMLAASILGFVIDSMDGVPTGPTAVFIDHKTRKSNPSTASAKVRYYAKVALLVFILYMKYAILCQPSSNKAVYTLGLREYLCLLCGTIFVARVLTQMALFWSRGISWVEVFGEAGFIVSVSLTSFAFAVTQRRGVPMGALEFIGMFIFCVGTYLNVWPEYTRYVWKKEPANAGHLYVGGWFTVCRHINYFGEVLSFLGYAIVTSAWWTIWVPFLMGIGMAIVSVPELDYYLKKKYALEWAAYTAKVKYQMIPYVW